MARVLVFRPSFDVATKYGNAWLGEIAKVASNLGHTVLDLDTNNATKDNLLEALEEFKPDLVFACSHGNASQFSGQGASIVFTACQNDQAMAGTQSYFVSCLMGQELAPSMEKKGASIVAAYISEFVWIVDTSFENPLEDPYAAPFLRAILEPSRSLLQGGSWKTFYNQTVSLFNQAAKEWFNKANPRASQIVAACEHDRDSLVVYGETAISPPTVFSAMPLMSEIGVGITLIALFL